MRIKTLLIAAGIALWAASPVFAQTAGGSFDSLSPGNQKIANALFSAQNTTGMNQTPLTRDQIADLKKTEGWGQVFKQMKSQGLVQSKNLGQVVSSHNHQQHAVRTTARSTTMTSRTRRSARVGTSRSHRFASHGFAARGGGFNRSRAGFASARVGGGFGRPMMGGGFGHPMMGGGVGRMGGGFGGMGMGGFGGMGHGGGGGHGR